MLIDISQTIFSISLMTCILISQIMSAGSTGMLDLCVKQQLGMGNMK